MNISSLTPSTAFEYAETRLRGSWYRKFPDKGKSKVVEGDILYSDEGIFRNYLFRHLRKDFYKAFIEYGLEDKIRKYEHVVATAYSLSELLYFAKDVLRGSFREKFFNKELARSIEFKIMFYPVYAYYYAIEIQKDTWVRAYPDEEEAKKAEKRILYSSGFLEYFDLILRKKSGLSIKFLKEDEGLYELFLFRLFADSFFW